MDKDWFVPGSTPRRDNNQIVPLVDGEEAWARVAAALRAARETIHMTWWMMSSEMELVRPIDKIFTSPAERESETILGVLMDRRNAGVEVRILLWQISSIMPWLVDDMVLRRYGQDGTFEMMYEHHPTRTLGSWHQKTLIIDSRIAYVGGMNTREKDWDTSQHLVYDYRRTPHATTGTERLKLQASKKLPHYRPRHDFMTEIVGPLVTDVQSNFVQRWNQAKAAGAEFAVHATTLPDPALNHAAGKISAQVARTMPAYPATPAGEHGVLDLYTRAIRNAEQYIYIEDQYFRSQAIAAELAAAIQRNEQLIVIAVAPPDYWHAPFDPDDDDGIRIPSPSSYWTAKAFETIRAVRPDFMLFFLQVHDLDASGHRVFVPIDIHAKLMIVDDVWYTIGSCNLNDRGFQSEGELNVGVLDAAARDLRKQLFSEHLQAPCPDDIQAAARLWFAHAEANLKAQKGGDAPKSRVWAYAQHGPAFPVVPPDWFVAR